MIAVLFARDDSRYKQLDGYDVYDIHRDARNYCLSYPVLAHPPCRAWGMLSHMANPRPDEKQLAYFALAQVRLNGGVLEHPAGSRLWKEAYLPLEGEFLMSLVALLLKWTNTILAMWLIKKPNFTFAELLCDNCQRFHHLI